MSPYWKYNETVHIIRLYNHPSAISEYSKYHHIIL